MSKTIKHPNSKEIFHAKRKARPQEDLIDEDEMESSFICCEVCGEELFPADLDVGICKNCIIDFNDYMGMEGEY